MSFFPLYMCADLTPGAGFQLLFIQMQTARMFDLVTEAKWGQRRKGRQEEKRQYKEKGGQAHRQNTAGEH